MIKVLLVDDQTTVIRYLSSSLNWESLNMNIAGYAANGVEALQLIAEMSPDIVITDIRMPVMDGLELIRNIRDFNYSCKIIILSAYGEFEYAKQSIQYGVSHYLLKPIDKSKLLDILNQISIEIEQNHEKEQEFMLMKKKIRGFVQEENNRKLAKLLHSKQDEPFAPMIFDPHLQRIVSQHFSCMIMDFPDSIEQGETETGEQHQDRIFIRLTKNDRLEFLSFYNVTQNQAQELAIHQEMIQYFHLGEAKYCGISHVHIGVQAVVKAYSEAKTALKGGFYSGSELNHFEELSFKMIKYDKKIYQVRDKLVEGLRLGQLEPCCRFFAEWMDHFQKNNISPEYVYHNCYELLFLIKHELDAEGAILNTEELQRLFIHYKVQDLTDYVNEQFRILTESITMVKTQTDHVVRKVKAYIEKNYNTNITLDLMAEHLFISKFYLSRMFKKVAGITVWDYLTQVRLDRAKQLLISTNLKSYEIAADVGYENTSHFSSVFKKQVGISPSEFKQLHYIEQYKQSKCKKLHLDICDTLLHYE
jgi:two-component system response regulator YesN